LLSQAQEKNMAKLTDRSIPQQADVTPMRTFLRRALSEQLQAVQSAPSTPPRRLPSAADSCGAPLFDSDVPDGTKISMKSGLLEHRWQGGRHWTPSVGFDR